MNEDLLHYIWKYQRINQNLCTTDNIPVKIEHPGNENTDAGPDFTNARIRIGDTLWAGNAEVHLRSSDWFAHRHNQNRAYDNIILHVVFEYDRPIFDKSGNRIATIELKNFVDNVLITNYKNFISSKNPIPCSRLLSNINEITKLNWFEKLAIERLQQKTETIFGKLGTNKNDWEQAFYEILARNFGFNVNAEPFEMLAHSLPQQYIAKIRNNLFQIEALLFGQAGFLDGDFTDDYPGKLKAEYSYLQKKHGLKPLDQHLWKFLRIRPNNFPTLRLAQFAAIMHNYSGLFSKLTECQTINDIYRLFDLDVSEYWHTHYKFDKDTGRSSKKLSKNTINLLIINTIVPFLFAFGKSHNDENYTEKALDFLTELPPEKNHIVNKFSGMKFIPSNAMQSQAVIQSYQYYCSQRKCLQCNVGVTILGRQ